MNSRNNNNMTKWKKRRGRRKVKQNPIALEGSNDTISTESQWGIVDDVVAVVVIYVLVYRKTFLYVEREMDSQTIQLQAPSLSIFQYVYYSQFQLTTLILFTFFPLFLIRIIFVVALAMKALEFAKRFFEKKKESNERKKQHGICCKSTIRLCVLP